ncbi:MAG: cyclase family protein, partial [Pseudomonadota bacterium]|nr:cyclase family protein [Pseudomonadota bacterium]
MTYTVDPYTGLQLYELSHVWGHGVPSMPGDDDVKMYRSVKHGQHGVMTHRIKMVMHSGTHMNAPIHMIQGGAATADIPLDRLFGNGVVLSIPKNNWELISAEDLQSSSPEIKQEDIVVIVTGWHHKYSDSLEYWGESPGLSEAAAEWLVSKKVKMVAVDTPQVDHPLATSLGPHRGGPLMNRVVEKYEIETGKNAEFDYPKWN